MCSFNRVIHSHSILKTVLPPFITGPKLIITDIISLLYLCIFSLCIINKFLPVVANDVKDVSSIINYLGIFSFAQTIISPKSTNALNLACHLFTPSQTIQQIFLFHNQFFSQYMVNLFTIINFHLWTR